MQRRTFIRSSMAIGISSALFSTGCSQLLSSEPALNRNLPSSAQNIKAFCWDVNWAVKDDPRNTGINGFAPPGAWKELDPNEHVSWCEALGVNVIQTFAVSSNGYAWVTVWDLHLNVKACCLELTT